MSVLIARSLAGAAAAAALAIGCGPAKGPESPAQVAVPAAAPAAPAAAEDAPAAPEAAEMLATEDALVRVPRPQGEGWECHAESVGRRGVRASFVQCKKSTAEGTMSLMAKDYEVPRAFVMSAEALSTVEYPKHYKKRWDQVKYSRSGPVDHHGYPAYEVAIELSREGGTRLHLVERVAVVGTHTLNLSADAPPAMYTAFEDAAKRWFDSAEFASLLPDPKQQARLAPGEAEERLAALLPADMLAAVRD